MNLDYIINLYKNYCNIVGKKFDERELVSDNYFIKWIQQLESQTVLFKDYLDFAGIELDPSKTVELEKGKYDSLGSDLATIISPYADTMNLPKGEICYFRDGAVIDSGNNMKYADRYNLFLTHNPYALLNIKNLLLLEKLGHTICLGMYGSKSDKDKNQKLDLLYNLRKYLSKKSKVLIDSHNDNYLAILKTKSPSMDKVMDAKEESHGKLKNHK